MSFKLSQEQTALSDSLRTFFTKKLTSEYLRKRISGSEASDSTLWKELLDLGLHEYFKSGEGTLMDLAVISFEAGRALLPENLCDDILGGTYLFSHLLPEKERDDLKKKLVGLNDSARFAIALSQKTNLAQNTKSGNYIPCGEVATYLIYFDTSKKTNSISIIATKDAQITKVPTIDGTIKLSKGGVTESKAFVVSGNSANHFRNSLYVIRSAEIAGACARAVEMTVEYSKTRKQFGSPIGGFQAVQHRLAEMHLDAESLRALAFFAAWAGNESHDQFNLAATTAISHACEIGPRCVEGAIQLHGGIGFTWEYDLHFYLRRVRAVEMLYRFSDDQFSEILNAV